MNNTIMNTIFNTFVARFCCYTSPDDDDDDVDVENHINELVTKQPPLTSLRFPSISPVIESALPLTPI
jgi:hypothetical protein